MWCEREFEAVSHFNFLTYPFWGPNKAKNNEKKLLFSPFFLLSQISFHWRLIPIEDFLFSSSTQHGFHTHPSVWSIPKGNKFSVNDSFDVGSHYLNYPSNCLKKCQDKKKKNPPQISPPLFCTFTAQISLKINLNCSFFSSFNH